jgi:hypothetical protein
MTQIKWHYDWISTESIVAQLKEELRSYFETGVIDDGMFPMYVDHCLKKVGMTMLESVDEIIPLRNKKAILPEGVVFLNDVLYAGDEQNIKGNIPGGTNMYNQTTTEVVLQPDGTINVPGNPEVGSTVQIVERTTNRLLNTYDIVTRLRPASLQAKNMCEDSRFKKFYDYPYYYDVSGRILSTNHPDGELLIRYKRYRTDDEGYPMVPDNVTMQDLVQYYLRYKIFEQLWNSVTDETYNQMQNKMQYYEQKYNDALIMARTEFIAPSFQQQKESILLRRHKFRRNYNIR